MSYCTMSGELFDELKWVRKDLAAQHQLPEFRIASDAALGSLCYWRPEMYTDIPRLSGWGQLKWALFGLRFYLRMKDKAYELGLPLQPVPPLLYGRPLPLACELAWSEFDRGTDFEAVARITSRKLGTVYDYWGGWLKHHRPATMEPWVTAAAAALVSAAYRRALANRVPGASGHVFGQVAAETGLHHSLVRLVVWYGLVPA